MKFSWSRYLLEAIWCRFKLFDTESIFNVDTNEKDRIVTRWYNEGDGKTHLFISNRIDYTRETMFFSKKVRNYRVELIRDYTGENEDYKSEVFIIPELCWGMFKNTVIPHRYAIDFIIDKYIRSGVV